MPSITVGEAREFLKNTSIPDDYELVLETAEHVFDIDSIQRAEGGLACVILISSHAFEPEYEHD